MSRLNVLILITLSIFVNQIHGLPPWIETITLKHSLPEFYDYFCSDNNNLAVTYGTTAPFMYYVWIKDILKPGMEITVQFDSEPTINLNTKEYDNEVSLRLKSEPDYINNIYTFVFMNETRDLRGLFSVQGERPPHHPPYITSFKVNGQEKCLEPRLGFFGEANVPVVEYYRDAPNKLCGRRKLSTQKEPRPLIVTGSSTNPGWWPWHVALFKQRGNASRVYFGGGTLISKRLILTAAHCVTVNGEPAQASQFVVALGKHYLFQDEKTTQYIKVDEIIVHDKFYYRRLDNDIAIVKLNQDASFNNYVQPACLWFDGIYDHIRTYAVTGVVVGWGFDKTDNVTNTLQLARMPQVPDATCITYQPIFYSSVLNGKRFCAGSEYGRPSGTPCNGDSGGGYVVLVNDEEPNAYRFFRPLVDAGAWYVKGIVSMTLSREDASVCDPNGYTVFTDVAQYRDWILRYLELDTNNEDITRINSNVTKNKDNVNNIYTFKLTNHTEKLQELFRVEGNTPYHQTHILSLKINGTEKCQSPDLEIFENHRKYRPLSKAPDKFCGRRRIKRIPEEDFLTADRPGFWPWHAAIYIVHNTNKYYICGGTLISHNLVLTTARCVTVRNETLAPEKLEVVIGKTALREGVEQTFKVTQVIVHEEYNYIILNNDIALIKLKDGVNYNNYVQPACLWFDEADQSDTEEVKGTIVSKVLNGEDVSLSVATIPIVPDGTCLLYQPVFYHILLNGLKFCAGPQNGTIPCTSSGHAFMVLIEDYKPTKRIFGPNTLKGPGAWYVKGIVSATLKSYEDNVEGCDPEGYVVFTDISKYRSWIVNYL